MPFLFVNFVVNSMLGVNFLVTQLIEHCQHGKILSLRGEKKFEDTNAHASENDPGTQ
jgi:hypothetical protein